MLVNALPTFQIILFLHQHLKNSNILRVSLVGLPGGSDGKEFTCNVGDLGSVPGLGRSPGGGHGNHSSILAWRISVDKGAWRATVHGVAKNQTQLRD